MSSAHAATSTVHLRMPVSGGMPSPQRPVAVPRLEWTVFDRIADAPRREWARLVPAERLFLQPDYLGATEEGRPERLEFRYAVLRSGGKLRAVAAFQLFDLSIEQCVPAIADPALSASRPLAYRAWAAALRATLGRIRTRVLPCGSVFVSGEHGFHADEQLDPKIAGAALAEVMDRITLREPVERRPDFLLVKELACGAEALKLPGFDEHALDPCMALQLRPQWRSFDDYLAALTSRCRGHARRARLAGRELVRRELDADDVRRNAALVDRLYRNVVARARVVPSTLNAAGFAALKAALPDAFSLVGYYLGDRLVGFNTRFMSANEVESYHLGVDDGIAAELALYRNAVYDDIALAIARGARTVRFGRTANEVKSSVGAEPVGMRCYVRHRSGWARPLLPRLIAMGAPPPWHAHRAFRSGA